VGTFTVLDDRALDAIAETFALGSVRAHRAIAAGTINSNFEVVTERGTYFVRVNEGKTEADVAWEARLVEALAAAGIATPPPLAARSGRPYAALPGDARKWVSVFAWRAGRHLAADQVTTTHATLLGAQLAALHVAGLALPAAWRRPSIYDHDHLVARYGAIASTPDPALAHALAIVGDELAAATLAAPLRRQATHGIIHGDLFRDNVLWAADAGQGEQISAVLDFEQASGGSLAYDLAVCVNDWCWTGAPRLDLARALLAGYRSVRGLTAADRAALPIELRAAAARFTLTRITDVYLAKVDNPDKDFRAFLARCEAWRGESLGALTATF
jgi:homoserine kinase type II